MRHYLSRRDTSHASLGTPQEVDNHLAPQASVAMVVAEDETLVLMEIEDMLGELGARSSVRHPLSQRPSKRAAHNDLDGATLIAGPSGSGKTTMGLTFLGQSSDGEPGLLFSCYEAPMNSP